MHSQCSHVPFEAQRSYNKSNGLNDIGSIAGGYSRGFMPSQSYGLIGPGTPDDDEEKRRKFQLTPRDIEVMYGIAQPGGTYGGMQQGMPTTFNQLMGLLGETYAQPLFETKIPQLSPYGTPLGAASRSFISDYGAGKYSSGKSAGASCASGGKGCSGGK